MTEKIEELRLLISDEYEEVSVLANAAAFLKEITGFFWIGFYIVKDDILILGPFQGSTACYRIKKGRGVCGTCWEEGKTIVVPDVHQFPGHIACSSLSKSEIVVPLKNEKGEVVAVLDVDSDKINDFTASDQQLFEEAARVVESQIYKKV